MDERLVKRLAKLLAKQQVQIAMLQSCLEQSEFPRDQMKKTLQLAFQHLIVKEEQKFYQLLTSSTLDAPGDAERDLWEQLGLGDLWGPSTPNNPEDQTPPELSS